jgi:ABC-type transport system involved in multi-copper enzyme maturation permease subunit
MARTNILRRFSLDWPLLGKELLEQAARKQTYVVRVAYALVFFGAFVFYYIRNLAGGPVLTLGRGSGPFFFLATTQLLTIFLFLPPMMAGALAQEKERDTLGLLFLTDLSPWELILQKYVGRLIPMLTLLFLSLPLMAVAYSLGGVSFGMLLTSAESLFLTCLAVGAIALECSAHEATTFQALIRCWGLCLFFVTCCWSGPLRYLYFFNAIGPAIRSSLIYVIPMTVNMVPYLILTWVFLVRAKQNLEVRAFVRGRNPFAQQFKQLDQYWKDTRKLTHAMLRKRDQEAYAVAKQVVRNQVGWDDEGWSLGKFLLAKMQVPNLLAFGIIFGFLGFIFLAFSVAYDPKSAPFLLVLGGVWVLALLTLPIQSANAIASERINERLGAILTTPLTGAELLGEWLVPVRRWAKLLAKLLLVLIAIEAVVKFSTQKPEDPRWTNSLRYVGISLLTVWIYPALVQWSCLWIGLRVRNQIRAMMTAFFLVAAWCLIPLPVAGYLDQTNLLSSNWAEAVSFISPVTVIRTAEAIGRVKSDIDLTSDMLVLIAMHLALAAGLMWKMRQLCLTRADVYLGRI